MHHPRHPSRRDFLKGAAGTAAALSFPTFLATSVRGANERLKFGIIGCGGQGMSNLKAFAKDVLAIADVDLTHAAKGVTAVQEKNGGAKVEVYQDYRRLLEHKDIDAVVISTPDHWHCLTTTDSCQAGKDVYVEKPLTLTIAEGRRMVDIARQTKRIVQTGSMQRSMAGFRSTCELVRNGLIGAVKSVHVGIPGVNYGGKDVPDAPVPVGLDYNMWLGPAPFRVYNPRHVHYNFRFFWDFAGGQMTNWGAHHIDIAQWGLGMDDSGPVTVEGVGDFSHKALYDVPSAVDLTYTYANGVTMHVSMKERGGTKFVGDKGWIWVNRGKNEASDPEILKTVLAPDAVHLYASKNHHANWTDCIRSRKLPICDVEIGHRSATACHLGNLAMRLGRKLTWDPVKEQFVGDDEADKMMAYVYRAPFKMP